MRPANAVPMKRIIVAFSLVILVALGYVLGVQADRPNPSGW